MRVTIRGILPRVTLPATSVAERAEGRIGTTIRDKYRIERVLGVGGMATVYLAAHRNGSRVAIKILHPELAVQEHHRERFVREAYVANSVEHPGSVRDYEVYCFDRTTQQSILSGLFFRARSGRLEGTWKCP